MRVKFPIYLVSYIYGGIFFSCCSIIRVGTAYREDVSQRVCAKQIVFVRLRGTMNLLVITFLGFE